MHVALCIRDYTKIRNILEQELPDEEIVEYSPTEVSEAAKRADVLIPIVAPVTAIDLKGSNIKLIQQFPPLYLQTLLSYEWVMLLLPMSLPYSFVSKQSYMS